MIRAVVCSLLMIIGSYSMAQGQSELAQPLEVYAAGSLRAAFTRIAANYEASTGRKVKLTFGASGLLRERIEKGEGAQVFASADTEHPQRLHAQAALVWAQPRVFATNALCALTSHKLQVTPQNLLAHLLEPQVRVGISTPKADPSGDYAFALFAKAEQVQAGARLKLEGKALQLTGGPTSTQPPAGRNAYAWLMEADQADLFLTYCTNVVLAMQELPSLRMASAPDVLAVHASYGVTFKADAQTHAEPFLNYLLSAPAQAVLSQLGFGSP
jgi:molybdate transport system substrate-binding protein